jgi:oligopeptidase A
VQPERVAFSLRLSQSRPLYDALAALKADGKAFSQLSDARRRAVDAELRDFTLGGVALEGAQKAKFNEVQQELSKLSTQFSNNVLDATKAFKKLVADPKVVEGLPPSALALASQQAAALPGHEGATPEKGPWLLTLDVRFFFSYPFLFSQLLFRFKKKRRLFLKNLDQKPRPRLSKKKKQIPVYMPVLQHAKDRGLREEMYRAYVTRAASPKQKDEKEEKREEEKNKEPVVGADGDNTAIIERTLALRKKKAALLRFDCFADLSMASKMATLESSRALLEKLAAAARAPAEKELEEVTAFARSKGFPAEEQLRHWDVSFWAERLREERYELTDEQLRPYFSLPKVLEGLFTLVERLFGVVVEEEPQVRRREELFFFFLFFKTTKVDPLAHPRLVP